MSAAYLKKIVKKNGSPDQLEEQVAQLFFELESNKDLSAVLPNVIFLGAKEIDTGANKQAIVISVPFRLLKEFRKVHTNLVRELEKKFSGRHVMIVGQRRILPTTTRDRALAKQKRPRSRTLTAVHEAILTDLVFPSDIVGKRTRVRTDGSKFLRVYLDRKDQTSLEHKLDTFTSVYKKLTGKEARFEFPIEA
eukprot:CAMPEP_0113879134 /NCGR_PEP_ID=MMETSP0780_2-20120614/7067_1 /TAXON_ID=652834 /ORGANISM="Palpitomonas bilix" /LENGTH=192 /DNA_ID=CAMNT_0000865677 /DNA_START=77 /DNA_END=656 /DNA_ORIENTATION=+ /assembly_acc=CAM_ASM_000599